MNDTTRWTRRRWMRAGMAGITAAALPGRTRAATTLRWATVLATNHPSVQMMERVAKQVREETGGSVEIQTFPAGQLGSSRDVIESTSSGAIQIVDEGAAQFGQFVPQFSILEAPYIWRDAQHVRRVLGSQLLDEMNAMLVSKRSMRIIGSTYYGKRHVTSGSKAIHSVDDMKGFKLRIPEVDTFRAMAEAWGARPTPLNIGELYLALSQGAVDGQENPLPTIQSNKFFEVQKYVSATNHVYAANIVLVSKKFWDRLSPQEQQWMQEAANEARAYQREVSRKAAQSAVADLQAKGMQYNDVSPAERARMSQVAKTVTDKLAASYDPAIVKLYNDELARARK